jgi:hypothetical protein
MYSPTKEDLEWVEFDCEGLYDEVLMPFMDRCILSRSCSPRLFARDALSTAGWLVSA